MISSKRKLSIQTLVIAFLVLVCLITAGAYTYAWFTDSKEGTGTITFGKVTISVQENTTDITTGTFTPSAVLMPGDKILDQDINVKLGSGSQNCYLKLTLTFTNNGCDAAFFSALKGYFTATSLGVTNHKWIENGTDNSGIFYYAGAAGTAPVVFSSTTGVVLLDDASFVLPTGTTQAIAQAQATGSITMTVKVSAIQSANVTGTVAALDALTF